MNTPRYFGKMKHRAKNARCYTAIMFVIETSNRQAGMAQPQAAADPFHPISLLLGSHAKAYLCMGKEEQRND